jgi:hypothetical protein
MISKSRDVAMLLETMKTAITEAVTDATDRMAGDTLAVSVNNSLAQMRELMVGLFDNLESTAKADTQVSSDQLMGVISQLVAEMQEGRANSNALLAISHGLQEDRCAITKSLEEIRFAFIQSSLDQRVQLNQSLSALEACLTNGLDGVRASLRKNQQNTRAVVGELQAALTQTIRHCEVSSMTHLHQSLASLSQTIDNANS